MSPIDYAQPHIEQADRPIGWDFDECHLVTITARARKRGWSLRPRRLPLRADELRGRRTEHQPTRPDGPEPSTVELRNTHVHKDLYWWTEDYLLDGEPAASLKLRIHGGHDPELLAATTRWRSVLTAFGQLAELHDAQISWGPRNFSVQAVLEEMMRKARSMRL